MSSFSRHAADPVSGNAWFRACVRRARTLAVCLLLIPTGCGFQLAGQRPLPDYLTRIAIDTDDTRSDVYLALERRLLDRDIVIDPQSTNRLELGAVQTGERILSVSVRNIPREYEVYYTVAYNFRRNGELLLERPSLTLTRDYTWSETEVLGKTREERQLRALIVDDLVDTILRQLASLR